MSEQLAIFTASGQVLYEHNFQGKKFSESQINAFLNHIIASPALRVGPSSGKYSRVDVTIGNENTKGNTRSFSALFHITKHPGLYIVVTSPKQSLELNRETEAILDLVVSLWESLGLFKGVADNMQRNEDCLDSLDETLAKFDKYLRVRYDESIKYIPNEHQSQPQSKGTSSSPEPMGSKGKKQKGSRQGSKNSSTGRKWGLDGTIEETEGVDSTLLDFSNADNQSGADTTGGVSLRKEEFGYRTAKGDYLIKEIDELLSDSHNTKGRNSDDDSSGYMKSALGFLQSHFLGNKVMTEEDLKPALDKLKQKLMAKNVAPEAADYLAKQVSNDLVGSKTESWTTVERTARSSLQRSLTELLSPGVSVDLLHEIQRKTSTPDTNGRKQPYVISVVGVNGVGKSTTLSKLAFWLLQNNLRVLIVACDTFRSGAVEQLRVHVENLAQLTDESHVRGSKNSRGKSGNDYVELFEAGYGGTDLVTKIAKQAIKYASDENFDVVLMDTAGRRHNDPTLMSPLKSFAQQAKPDKIIMVGEALVGTDSVQQAKNFNDAFGRTRNLDFFIISKCDTVGEMLGTMVNMVYATGIPILFVGVGQTYTDLRTLSVNWAVNTLMS